MKESKEEKRARLQAKAAQAIDEYLEWEEKNPQPDLTQIEDIALKLRKEFGQEIAQVAIENQASRTPAPGPKCAKCGDEMRYKGKKRTQSREPNRAPGCRARLLLLSEVQGEDFSPWIDS